MNIEEQNKSITQTVNMIEKREQELQNLKNAIFRYWDRFGGEINDVFIKVFPLNDSMIDKMVLNEWLLEWNGGIDVAVSKLKELIGKKINIRDNNDPMNYGSYDFYFEIKGISDITTEKYMNSISVDISVYDEGSSMQFIFLDNNDQTFTLSQALETEEAYEVRVEIQDIIDEWLINNFSKKNGVKLFINKITYI